MSTPFDRRPYADYLLASPLAALVYPLHHILLRLRGPPRLPPPDARPIRVVCISDTHTLEWTDIPDGDLLIHAGDLSNDGSAREIQAAVDWLNKLPHPHKVVIGGNHDSYFDIRSRRPEDRDQSYANVSSSTASIRSIDDFDSPHLIDWGDIHYLQHSSVTLTFHPPPQQATASSALLSSRPRSLILYGAPQIPAIMPLGPEHAFTYPPHHDAWSGTVPANTDVLITHTPPQCHRDLSPIYSTGCPYLLAESWRVRPRLHVFGHLHAAYGKEPVHWDEAQKAWERICTARLSRAGKSRINSFFLGFLRDLFDISGWVDSARVVAYGILGIVWAKVWGGELRGGWMVNAACMYRDSGQLRNKPQVIIL